MLTLHRDSITVLLGITVKQQNLQHRTGRLQFIEHYPPDTTAAIFWLKNRQPEKWRDKKEVDANVDLGDELESLTDEQLQAIIDGKEKE